MKKTIKKYNILKNSQIRLLVKSKELGINSQALKEIEKYTFEYLDSLLEAVEYELKISGKKIIKPENVKNAIKKMNKEDKVYEI